VITAAVSLPETLSRLTPPALVAPAPNQVSFGRVAGTVSPGTVRLVVRAGGRRLADRTLDGTNFELPVDRPARDVTGRVTAVGPGRARATTAVGPVYGLPPAAVAGDVRGREDPALARRIRRLVRAFPGTAAAYVQELTTGAGAAWNARARFPAASTVKLALAVAVLSRLSGPPPPGSGTASLMREMIVFSDNRAANALEATLGGSTSGGSALVNALMASLGIHDTEMYGGYILNTAAGARPIPIRVDEQPAWGYGKYTTAYDLARLFTLVHLAAAGRGRLARGHGVTPAEARWLLFLLAHSTDHGKLDRFLRGRGLAIPHKAGWVTAARHDAGIVYWRGGALAVAVMTYGAGVGTASDVLQGRVAAAGLDRFRELRHARHYDAGRGRSA
jgi:D-alanyl-D-alanine carboxypeptidase (penicillin-binding protein 5/6)/beta-lactamase class A